MHKYCWTHVRRLTASEGLMHFVHLCSLHAEVVKYVTEVPCKQSNYTTRFAMLSSGCTQGRRKHKGQQRHKDIQSVSACCCEPNMHKRHVSCLQLQMTGITRFSNAPGATAAGSSKASCLPPMSRLLKPPSTEGVCGTT